MGSASNANQMRRVLASDLEDLPDPLPIPPLAAPFNVDITPPGSKSITNRALLLAGVASGHSLLRRPLIDADDSERMLSALERLGAHIEHHMRDDGVTRDLRVRGVGGRLRGDTALYLGNAGTAMRFITAMSVLADGQVLLDGSARMRQRPIGQLATVLRGLGAGVEFSGESGFPPLKITPPQELRHRGHMVLPSAASSQFISALLMLAPWLPGGVTLELRGHITSKPYIVMTLELLRRLGAQNVAASSDFSKIHVGHGPLDGFTIDIEPDASGATYFWAAAAMTPGATCRIRDLSSKSIQGDARFPAALTAMGATAGFRDNAIGVAAPRSTGSADRSAPALHGVRIDLGAMPDTAMTLASVCCFASGPSEISGLRTLRIKETDRIGAMKSELEKIGVGVEIFEKDDDEGIRITPPSQGVDCSPDCPRIEFDTYDDHRMAMSLALIGLRRPNVFIRDPGCVAKTYPEFWAHLSTLYGDAG
ncbi:MAG: 3-phosphoshikimate 1-carboxyvinyltransferase [Phycisphaeraceae bacterium]|nr:MAG: 3-phosphoshikimate 1-carboxyvinyltransferase [Phycisphaeraceae bacterium]